MSWPFHSPDSFNGGFWTSKEGSLDWCEENYIHTSYVAETTNTLSNASYIILALYGIWNCQKQGLPTRFVLCNLSLLCVGLGSASYHATLRSWAQAFDELPMLYTVSFVTYTVFDMDPISRTRSFVLPAFSLTLASAWTIAYAQIQTPVFHEISFALLGLFTAIRVALLLGSPPLSSSLTLSRCIRSLYYEGLVIFVSGFLVWNLDNWYCTALRAWRADVGWPATWLAQGHAYWHVATGIGAYRMIVASELLFLVVTQRQDRFIVEGIFFPAVRRSRVRI